MKLKSPPAHPGDGCLELIREFPLRVIRADRELARASRIALRLASKGEKALSAGETEYLDVLDRLIEDYEEKARVMPLANASPLQRLRSLTEGADMSASDLGRLLGNRCLGSLLLAGRRELSKCHIRILAEHFRLDAGYFL